MPKPKRADLIRRRLSSIQSLEVPTSIEEGNKSIWADLGRRGHLSLKRPTSIEKGFQAGGMSLILSTLMHPGSALRRYPTSIGLAWWLNVEPLKDLQHLRPFDIRGQNSRFDQIFYSSDKSPAPPTSRERTIGSLMAGPFYIKGNIPSDRRHALEYHRTSPQNKEEGIFVHKDLSFDIIV